MKSLKECVAAALATPMNTIGMGNVSAPTDTSTGTIDTGPMCIDIKTGKVYKRRKKFRRYKIV